MKHAGKAFEIESFTAIVTDLGAARREGRFDDALHHLAEIFVIHQHTESAPLKACPLGVGTPSVASRARQQRIHVNGLCPARLARADGRAHRANGRS
jgi:hypothetical protein